MSLAISAQKRTELADDVRAEGKIPAVLYGPGVEPVSVSVPYTEFEKLYAVAGESTLVDFSIDGGKSAKVLIQAVQYNPLNRKVSHIDFRQIRMDKEIETAVELVFVGVAPAIKELGGTLSTPMSEINIKCLPDKLLSSFDVDLSILKTFDDAIYVKDLKLPEGITSMDNPDGLVAKVSPSMTEDDIKAMEEANAAPVDLSKIEISEERGKKEEETPAEGEEKKAE